MERNIFALPVRYGGLGIFNPVDVCKLEYGRSISMTKPLVDLINLQNIKLNELQATAMKTSMVHAKKSMATKKLEYYQSSLASIKENCSERMVKILDGLSVKGVSSWLTTLPLDEFGFTPNKQEFCDAILLRYEFPLKNLPKVCACSSPNSVDHALSCPKGGYSSLRHNQIRDLEAHWLSDVCKDVRTEPPLIPLTGEQFPYKTANTDDGARLDISARGVWNSMDKTFFDVRVLHLGAKSNWNDLQKALLKHEQEKKRTYNERVLEVEKQILHHWCFPLQVLLGMKQNDTISYWLNYCQRNETFRIVMP